jgi:hypothetical protein
MQKLMNQKQLLARDEIILQRVSFHTKAPSDRADSDAVELKTTCIVCLYDSIVQLCFAVHLNGFRAGDPRVSR